MIEPLDLCRRDSTLFQIYGELSTLVHGRNPLEGPIDIGPFMTEMFSVNYFC